MNSNELSLCENEKARAREEVRAFYEACVTPKRRVSFALTARTKFPDLWQEIEELKVIINSTPNNISSYCYACRRYVVVSKEVIRKVCVSLLTKVSA